MMERSLSGSSCELVGSMAGKLSCGSVASM